MSSSGSLASSVQEEGHHRRIRVCDCRFQNRVTEKVLEASGLDFNGFLQKLHKEFPLTSHKIFVLTTTDRTVLDNVKFEELEDGATLLLLQTMDQALPEATKEHVNFLPHYDTLIKSGMYEYYASEGQNSLPYSLAELVDNALSATYKNTDMRTIEIRMLFDETVGKSAVIVLDNGCGMTSQKLNKWAIYRLSKFAKGNNSSSAEEGYGRPDPVPRSLNCDISYFGVGGKQAAFYIGNSVRMITKTIHSPDVHEMVLSADEFERKAKNKEDIYSGCILNRKPGDLSHVQHQDECFLQDLIKEENGKGSFTAVVITGVRPEHITFLRTSFEVWTRKLAHSYHYYIHGYDGNNMRRSSVSCDLLPKLDIKITLREKPPRCPRVVNLREIDNDMQSLYINTAEAEFEFQVDTENDGRVDGVLRYHPFLYDRETYPEDPDAVHAPPDEDNGDIDSEVVHHARGNKAIFECFWNGRLIPYTAVETFDWCAQPAKGSKVPAECYSRFSGVLFTNDKFEVTTNKLTFMDLELKLKSKKAIFTRVVNGQKQRRDIEKQFTQWLNSCHETLDKQVLFRGFKEIIKRTDVTTKKMQHPWATFTSIEWDGKTYRKGELVKSQKTQPIVYGTVVQFLLYGQHDGDVFATRGQVEVAPEPRGLYDKNKIIPISKIDRAATSDAIKQNIDSDLAKLPHKLTVVWQGVDAWPNGAVRPAGTPLGPLRVDIVNKNGEAVPKMPKIGQGTQKNLAVQLKVVWHSPKGDQEIVSHVAQRSPKWGHWFKAMTNLTNLGKYTLSLNTVLHENNAPVCGGILLPSTELKFTIKEGCPERFIVGPMNTNIRVGVPFDIPLELKDEYGHSAEPPAILKPLLESSIMELKFLRVEISGKNVVIKSVKARGKCHNYSKKYDLKVILPGLKEDSQTFNISLLPGLPHTLHVMPENDPVKVENGNPVSFNFEIHDENGNTTHQPKLIVHCQLLDFSPLVTDCSSTGAGQMVTKPINLNMVKGEPQVVKVTFDVPSQTNIPLVARELKVMPSSRICRMLLFKKDEGNLFMKDKERIEWLAGSLLENLCYKLYDEGGEEVPLTDEIANMIKVNWTADVKVKNLVQGKLPDVQVSTNVKEERFYQVSYQDQRVSVSFTIVPCPDGAKRLQVRLTEKTVSLGETLPGSITLELVDRYHNVTKTLTSTCMNQLTVTAEDLDTSALSFTWQESSSSVLVSGVRFLSGMPGSRELCFTLKGFVATALVTVTPGLPAQLKLVSEPKQPLQVLNEHAIATPFEIQLCDQWGNPSPDQRVVVELKSSSSALKVVTKALSQPVNTEGKATFVINRVSGPIGEYELQFKGSFNERPIPILSVNLVVTPDPYKPVRLQVEYDTTVKCTVGKTFPVFSVIVVSEEGSPVRGIDPRAASMSLWKTRGSVKTPPQNAMELMCSKPLASETDDRFHFRDKVIPEEAGKYTIQFSLRTTKTIILYSEQVLINAVASHPVKLAPDSLPHTPVVSNDVDTNRTLVENMNLWVMDTYGNNTGLELQGKVVVLIKQSVEDDNSFPLFEGQTDTFELILSEGKAHVTRLAIMKNSPGKDGSTYILQFKPEVPTLSTPLAPFELPFHFYNDAENQQKMLELSKKKDELTVALRFYKDVFSTSNELLQLFNSRHEEAKNKEVVLKTELNKRKVIIPQAASITSIDKLLREKKAEVKKVINVPRRVCTLPNLFKEHKDALGMVGHLALVENEDAARVISWHIIGNMDCIITKTLAAAEEIYYKSQGRQQVMPLDNIFVQAERPLPHLRNGCLFNPSGNPVYARDLLQFPDNEVACKMVFRNLLGETIVIDDLQSGNMYRKTAVQKGVPCGTILTREGERISAKGMFGGTNSKAPSIEALRGVFGAPFPQVYYTLKQQIDLLEQYRTALEKKDLAKKECNEHIRKLKSPETLRKEEEMEEKKRQLEEINEQLGSNIVRQGKRSHGGSGATSGVSTKRPRQRSK